MLAEYKTRTNIGVGTGLLLQLLIRAYSQSIPGGLPVIVVLMLAAFGLFIWGCCSYAKGKGYHWGWGFLGMLNFFGLIVLIFFKDRHKAGSVTLNEHHE